MKGKHLNFAVGLVVGATLFGGGTALAAGILAEPSTQTFVVDGQNVNMEAYAIGGHNYVQLRDIGRAVDFGVTYDGARNAAVIDSTAPYVEEAPTTGELTPPQSDAPFRPLAGDVVRLDDGTTFTVTEPKPEEPALPEPTCDWSLFPTLELPKMRTTAWHEGQVAGTVGILNLHETRRMQYTLYNAVPNCPELWQDGKLKLDSKGQPIFNLTLGITSNISVQPFWPWRDEQLTQVFYSAPAAAFSVEAWDMYKNGKFLYTQYTVQGF